MGMEVVDILRSESAHSHTEHLYMDAIIAMIGRILVHSFSYANRDLRAVDSLSSDLVSFFPLY
jgi:hypothetical protein